MRRYSSALCLAALIALASTSSAGVPLGTGFTYQGQLNQGGTPVNGTVTLRFGLWDAASLGTQVGGYEILANVTATNGLFTVVLNSAGAFGANAFNGEARWLEVAVCADPVCSSLVTLSPRQSLTPTPYSQLSAVPWQLLSGSAYYNGGNVGIGTSTPHAPLEIKSGFGTEVLRLGLDGADYHFLSTGFHGAQPYLNFLGFSLEHTSGDIRRVMTLQGDGSVGIGTAAPSAALEVRGDIKLGGSGQYYAASSPENLRFIRGHVEANGVPTRGCCFSVSHCATGCYEITYSQAFADIPSVTVGRGDLQVGLAGLGPGSTPTTYEVRVVIFFRDVMTDADFDFIAVGGR